MIRNTAADLLRSIRKDMARGRRLAWEATPYFRDSIANAEKKILALLNSRSLDPVTIRERNDLLREIDLLLRQNLTDANPLILRMIQDVTRFSVNHQAVVIVGKFGVRIGKGVTADSIVNVYRAFEPAWRPMWEQKWAQRLYAIRAQLQTEMTRATIRGESFGAIAKRLTDPVGDLQIPEVPKADVFARALVRTEFDRITNDVSRQFAVEAGMDKAINIGVADDRQSDECYRASNAGPMTYAEWDKWPDGPPPRHFANCRCWLQGIPDFATAEDWSQPNAYVERRLERRKTA